VSSVTATLTRKTPLKRSPIKRKPAKRKITPKLCDWSNRCKRRAPVIVSETERYCTGHARKEADKLQRIAIFERDGYTCQSCIRSGTAETLQRAHIISRGARFIEYHEDNLVTLCPQCHLNFTLKPGQWSVWLAINRPGVHDRLSLMEAAAEHSGDPIDLAEIIRRYQREAA
jgi:5-methylcytosine-specific restriction endonuclease McrA